MTENKFEETKTKLRELVDVKNLVDVGGIAADILRVSKSTLSRAVKSLREDDDYTLFYIPTGSRNERGLPISKKVIGPHGMKFTTAMANRDKILGIEEAEQASKISRRARRAIDKVENPKRDRLSPEDIKWMVFHMRNSKRAGMSNVAIAKEFGVNESTVRHHLKKPLTSEEKLIETMIEAVRNAKRDILASVVNTPEFLGTFGAGYGPEYFLRVEKSDHNVKIHKSSSRESMKFTLSFEAVKVEDNR